MIPRRILGAMICLAVLSNFPSTPVMAWNTRTSQVRRRYDNKRRLGYSSNNYQNYNSNSATYNNANNYANQNNAYSGAYSNYANYNNGNNGNSGNYYNGNSGNGNSGYSSSSSSSYSYSNSNGNYNNRNGNSGTSSYTYSSSTGTYSNNGNSNSYSSSSGSSTTSSNATSSNSNSTYDGEYYETENMDDAYDAQGDDAGSNSATTSSSSQSNYNYLWQRDDDDDYYENSSGYWASNKNLKAGSSSGSGGYTGGQYVQHDDDASRSYGNGFDKSKTKKRGYFAQDDDEYDRDNRVGMGLLSQGQRIFLAVGIALGMTAVLLFVLFSPVILSSMSHCFGGMKSVKEVSLRKLSKREREAIKKYRGSRRRRSQSRTRDMTTSLADSENQLQP